MNATKRKQARIYLGETEEAILDELTTGSPFSEAQIMSLLVSSALQAVRDNKGKISIPLYFDVVEEPKGKRETVMPPKQKAA